MKFVALPDGRRVDLEGSSYALEANQTLVVNTNGCCSDPKMYRFTAVTPGDAYVLIQAIDNFVSGSANISSVPVSSGGIAQLLKFISITPNIVNSADYTYFTLTGTGFTTSLVIPQSITYNDGTHAGTFDFGYSGPTTLTAGTTLRLFYPGLYRVYYDLQDGVGPRDTGLTIISNP